VVKPNHVSIKQLWHDDRELIIAETPKEFDCAEALGKIGFLDRGVFCWSFLHVHLREGAHQKQQLQWMKMVSLERVRLREKFSAALMPTRRRMSALGQKQTFSQCNRDVRFTPESGHVPV
jgi:hypothetical protein